MHWSSVKLSKVDFDGHVVAVVVDDDDSIANKTFLEGESKREREHDFTLIH